MKKILFKDIKTSLFTKTKIYKKNNQNKIRKGNTNLIPTYKFILSRYHQIHITKMEKINEKPLSINSMKMKYGLPNNLDHYFITNPQHRYANKPITIHYRNAYKLILLLEIDIDSANLFLESLNIKQLGSSLETNLSKAVHYALRCSFSLEKTNKFLAENNIETLY